MMIPCRQGSGEVEDGFRRLCNRSKTMRWETPQATEMRFGMEITMYIANR